MSMTLKQARLINELTLANVAEKVGKTPQTVSAWENGIQSISAEDYLKLCSLYKMQSLILPKKSS